MEFSETKSNMYLSKKVNSLMFDVTFLSRKKKLLWPCIVGALKIFYVKSVGAKKSGTI